MASGASLRDDAALVRKARSGDKDAFGCLCSRYHTYASTIAKRLSGRSWASEDLVQESFLRAYLGIRGLRDVRHFRSWLVGILLNVWREYSRDRENSFGSLEARREPGGSPSANSGGTGPEELRGPCKDP